MPNSGTVWKEIAINKVKRPSFGRKHSLILKAHTCTMFLLTSALGTCAITLKRHLTGLIDNVFLPAKLHEIKCPFDQHYSQICL